MKQGDVPKVSEAIKTPPANVTPRTDVPVTYGFLRLAIHFKIAQPKGIPPRRGPFPIAWQVKKDMLQRHLLPNLQRLLPRVCPLSHNCCWIHHEGRSPASGNLHRRALICRANWCWMCQCRPSATRAEGLAVRCGSRIHVQPQKKAETKRKMI